MSGKSLSHFAYLERVKVLRSYMRGFEARDGYPLDRKTGARFSSGKKSAINKAWNNLSKKLDGQPVVVGKKVSSQKLSVRGLTGEKERLVGARELERGEELEEFQTAGKFSAADKKKYKVAIVHAENYPIKGREEGTINYWGGAETTEFLYDPLRPEGSRVIRQVTDGGWWDTLIPLPSDPRQFTNANIKAIIDEYAADFEYFRIETESGTVIRKAGWGGNKNEIAAKVRKFFNEYSTPEHDARDFVAGIRAYSDGLRAQAYGEARVRAYKKAARKSYQEWKKTPEGLIHRAEKRRKQREQLKAENHELRLRIAELERQAEELKSQSATGTKARRKKKT